MSPEEKEGGYSKGGIGSSAAEKAEKRKRLASSKIGDVETR